VSTSAQLIAALTGTAKDIVLADGNYDTSGYFQDSNGSRLYGQHLGKAVLNAGLVVGGNSGSGGAVVQGLAFNVSDPSKTFQGGVVQTWGSAGTNTQILDCTFDGNGVVPVGLLAYNPQGLVAQRLTFAHFTDEGIRASDNVTVAYGASTPVIKTISDISVTDVSRPVPGSSNGTAEAGLFIGHPVTNGVRRIKVRNVSWSGIETANNAWDTTYSDLDIDMSGTNSAAGVGVGVYMEHFSRKLVFTNFVITGSRVGINGEWNDGVAGNAAAHNDTIQNGTIDASGWTKPGETVGVYLDTGTDTTTITGVQFKNQSWAGIGAYQTVGTNQFSGNTFSLAPGAAQITYSHM
jgi:hypothetical protein